MKILLALLALPVVAFAASDIKEMVMPTEVGEIVLTLEECPVKNQYGFDYYGYATDPGKQDHHGCWNADEQIVQIWFLDENVVGVYNKTLFKPRFQIWDAIPAKVF